MMSNLVCPRFLPATHGPQQMAKGNLQSERSLVAQCRYFPRGFLLPLCFLAILFTGSNVRAEEPIRIASQTQESTENAPDEQLAEASDLLQILQQQIARLSPQIAEADVDATTREQVEGLFGQASADLKLVEELRKQNIDRQQKSEQLKERAKKLRQPPVLPDGSNSAVESMSEVDLEAALATGRVSLNAAEQTLVTDQQTLDQSPERKQLLQDNVTKTEKDVTEAAEQLRALPAKAVTILDAAIRVAAETAHLRATAAHDLAQTTLAQLDAELSLHLPSLQVARQKLLIKLKEERLQSLEIELAEIRKEKAREELTEAQMAEKWLETISNPEIKELGQLRLQLATENDRMTQQDSPKWEQRRKERERALKDFRVTERRIRKRVEKFGTEATRGHELLFFGKTLPSIADIRKEMNEIEQLTAGWQLRQIEYSKIRHRAADVRQMAGESATADENEILDSISALLDQVVENNRQLFLLLADLDAADRSTIVLIDEWSAFSSEHALWLRSHETLTRQDVSEAFPSFQRDGRRLVGSLKSVAGSMSTSLWALLLPAGLAIAVLLAVQSRAKAGLLTRGEEAIRKTCISLQPTGWALLLSVGMAAEGPLFLMLVGNILQSTSDAMATALGQSLSQLGGIAMWLNFFRQVFRQGGLASHHLMWNHVITDRLRRWLRMVFIVAAVPTFLFLVARYIPNQTDTLRRFALERLLFLVLMVCSTALLFRLLFPVNGTFARTLIGQSRFLKGTRYIWTCSIVVAPLFLAICSATGFHHTALSLCDRLGWSIVTASGIILGWSLVMRWLRINHRVMRMELARERAQQKAQQQDQSGEASETSILQPAMTDDAELIVFGTQARQLIRNAAILVMIGCAWGIWSDILPALRIVDRYELWRVSEQVDCVSTTEAGEEETTLKWESRSITISSLLLAAFTVAATVIGVRQLPGLIGMILLRQTSLDSGVRYTATTVIRYLVLIVGTTMVCHSLGLRWSQVQWLVAGLSVGLGFGLQEVFANFVSGIILLIERPIRIGDVVTIDGVSGVVSKIQIRATSITDWDRREYIVPNRELVTGKLLNWTLSDSTNRIVLTVGIAYASDPDKARATMLRIAQEHPNVLDDPGPIATFENFGDSSLDLILRAYLPDMDNRLGTITELHTQIHRIFAEEGIDIPYPQREVRML
jgi:potassium efflux system protein